MDKSKLIPKYTRIFSGRHYEWDIWTYFDELRLVYLNNNLRHSCLLMAVEKK